MRRSTPPKPDTVIAVEDFLCHRSAALLNAFWSETYATWNLDSGFRRSDRRRQDYLTLLAAIREVRQALDELADRYTVQARDNGADFAQIGVAAGVSRQAARQRYRNRTITRPVNLVEGPWDGRSIDVPLGQSEVRLRDADPWLEGKDWMREDLDPNDDPVYAVYRRSPEDHDVYRFHRHENPDQTPTTAPNHQLRIYRLAESWGTSPLTVLRCGQRLVPTLRGYNSRLPEDIADTVHVLIQEVQRERGW